MSNIFKILLTLCCLLWLTYETDGQTNKVGGGKLADRIEARRIGFLTAKLDLTPDEAKVFWPVFNEYSSKQKALRQDRINQNGKMETMSDAELEKAINEWQEREEKELAIRKEYLQKFKKVLPIRKVGLLIKAEREFKAKLLAEIQEKRNERGSKN